MRWYVRSADDGDTHRGTLVGGSVVAECGVRFRSGGVLLVPSGRFPFTDAICPGCYPWALDLGDHHELLALATVSGGGVALDGEDYVAAGGLSPVALFLLTFALERFARAGMVELAEPDEHGLARVSLTEAGLARYQALCELQQVARTRDDTQTPTGHRLSSCHRVSSRRSVGRSHRWSTSR